MKKTHRLPSFAINDILPSNEDYVIVDRTLGRPKLCRPVGGGSAGLIYRAKYKKVIDRAIKFLSPPQEGDEQAQLEFPTLKKEFAREIQLLIKLTHENICKIVDFGQAGIGGNTYDFYVMEYIEGDRFDDYIKICTGQEFLEVLLQIINALEYLQANRGFHMDVKEENVFIQRKPGAKPHAILLDLGGAKLVPDAPMLMNAQTIYISTKKATRTERHEKLGHFVTYKQLWDWNIDLDFYALGIMVSRALKNDALRTQLRNFLTQSGLTGLEWIVSKLIEGSADDPIEKRYYQSATQLADDVRRLFPGYTWPIGLPELSLVVGPASIQLSRQRVGLTPELLQVVNHPIFQRLRNIPQLEYVSLIYPGARQSRFEHSLSTFHTARIFLCKLLEDPEFRMMASSSYVHACLLVALLHDIGHYPLSHAFEDFCEDQFAHDVKSEYQIIPDNMLFDSFVCPQNGDPFHEIINETCTNHGIKVTLDELLKRLFPQSCNLLTKLAHLEHDTKPPVTMLHALINSAVDVDKVTYLSDDSYNTGMPFGAGIDLYGLVDALVPPRGNDKMYAAIGITENGLAAAESIILSRFWMISRVYWHRTNRAIMAMHKFVIAHLVMKKVFSFQRYFKETMFMSQSSATKFISDWYNESVENISNNRNPLFGLESSFRDIYGRLLTISNGPSQRGSDTFLYEKIVSESPFAVLYLGEELRQFLTSELPELGLIYGDILVDAPYRSRDKLGTNVMVYLDRLPDAGLFLTGPDSVSPMLRNLQMDFEQNVKKCRIFIHSEVMEKLRRSGDLDRVRDITRGFLETKYNAPPLGT